MAKSKKAEVEEVVVVEEPPKPSVVEKDGHAVISIEVPARTAEVSVAHSVIEGCAVAAVEAWDKVRNATGGDVEFAAARPDFRRELLNIAEGIYRGSKPTDSPTTMAKFEAEVARIKARQDEEKKAALAAA